jgi:hypothetical protein
VRDERTELHRTAPYPQEAGIQVGELKIAISPMDSLCLGRPHAPLTLGDCGLCFTLAAACTLGRCLPRIHPRISGLSLQPARFRGTVRLRIIVAVIRRGCWKTHSRENRRNKIASGCAINDLLGSLRHFPSPKFALISEIPSFSTATGVCTN